MSIRFYLAFVGNLALLSFALRARGKAPVIGICAYFFVLCGVANFYGWHWLSSATYNTHWRMLKLFQLTAESVVCMHLLRRSRWMSWPSTSEALSFIALAVKLDMELQSSWAWDVFDFAEGLRILHMTQWINLLVIALLCRVAYNRKRPSRS